MGAAFCYLGALKHNNGGVWQHRDSGVAALQNLVV
jgi:hypothetical protein